MGADARCNRSIGVTTCSSSVTATAPVELAPVTPVEPDPIPPLELPPASPPSGSPTIHAASVTLMQPIPRLRDNDMGHLTDAAIAADRYVPGHSLPANFAAKSRCEAADAAGLLH
ncbi:MAG: hypothetical protein H0T76_22260 [Nannocystis sp.]|nr:hypothetical protein [Nannocystis sp.]MBA3549206.1 hypothetical protein [Nannocystis sp.]